MSNILARDNKILCFSFYNNKPKCVRERKKYEWKWKKQIKNKFAKKYKKHKKQSPGRVLWKMCS